MTSAPDIRDGAWQQVPQQPFDELLHCVTTVDDTTGYGTAACGFTARFQVPGYFTLRGVLRCPDCCAVKGIPEGLGAPARPGIEETAARPPRSTSTGRASRSAPPSSSTSSRARPDMRSDAFPPVLHVTP